ncbi:class I SAM-dependent methyltransferase [Halosegnis sp.]|uniref:class I SAM-dependent methyltransferase n=1 Tax=Halosegnis sp. TaxID=2864959 RepID=UPI0035D3ECC6
MSDPFGRAIRDHYRGERTQPLWQVDGADRLEHPIERFYFGERDPDDAWTAWFESHFAGPHLDMGAGAGRDALYYQAQFETVAIEASDALVTVLRERGVSDARWADMFDLRATFPPDRFRSAQAYGTQLQLACDDAQLMTFLEDLAVVTTADATAILDAYDPTRDSAAELLGYRSTPADGVAYRVFHFEYEEAVGETLLFRLVSPARLRAVCTETPWSVETVRYDSEHHYHAVLKKA